MEKKELKERTKQFALKVIKVVEMLPRGGQPISLVDN
jgi:hypothetical protein